MTAIQKYKVIKQAHTAAHKAFVKETKAAFRDVVLELFKAFPDLKTFGWVQYRPYWSDGDTPIFSADLDEEGIFINESRLYEYDDTDPIFKAHLKAAREISKALSVFGEELLEEMFGDHAVVTIKRNGKATVGQYDHD
jgi:hypothetical protein